MSSRIKTDQDMNIGWQCPGCGSCYSPWTERCTRCGNETKIHGGIGRPEPGTFIPINDYDEVIAPNTKAEPTMARIDKGFDVGPKVGPQRLCRGCGRVQCNNTTAACDGRV